jgi:hypothetical protein
LRSIIIGFFQWLDELRYHAGPRFLEQKFDPTASLWDYALWLHPERRKDKLSIAEAASAISVTRGTLKGYISAGRIHKNSDGTIDTCELQRAGFIIRN